MRKAVEAAQGLRERKKARTREAIIEAALDLFERKGYDATTVEDIAAAAEVSPRTFFRYFESKLDLIMARSGEKHAGLGLLLADRPAGEGLVEAVREAMRAELAAQLDDPLVRREFQVMLTTPSLRNLAREHFYEEEAEMVPAVADRLGRPHDDLVAHVAAGVVASALWVAVDRWIAEGADLARLDPMIDAAFAVLTEGVEGAARRAGN
ncbi:MAG TPA: TetR family transcriptional regulator [Acidimicrobiales bacterium]|nr:TetR family transcriptional regulator [Acidimicrobiales bacterium]